MMMFKIIMSYALQVELYYSGNGDAGMELVRVGQYNLLVSWCEVETAVFIVTNRFKHLLLLVLLRPPDTFKVLQNIYRMPCMRKRLVFMSLLLFSGF